MGEIIIHRGDEILHYGIEGQKWGRRRWQNADGSYNDAGLARYFPNGEFKKQGTEEKKRLTREELDARSDEWKKRVDAARKNAKSEETETQKTSSKGGSGKSSKSDKVDQLKSLINEASTSISQQEALVKEQEEIARKEQEAYEAYKKVYDEVLKYNEDHPDGPWKFVEFSTEKEAGEDDDSKEEVELSYEVKLVDDKRLIESQRETMDKYLKIYEEGDESLKVTGYKPSKEKLDGYKRELEIRNNTLESYKKAYSTAKQSDADEYLIHSGVLGMKWGIRRYQNPDGSLTSAGRERYGIGPARKSVKNMSDEEIRSAMARRQLEYEYKNQARAQRQYVRDQRDAARDQRADNRKDRAAERKIKSEAKAAEQERKEKLEKSKLENKRTEQDLEIALKKAEQEIAKLKNEAAAKVIANEKASKSRGQKFIENSLDTIGGKVVSDVIAVGAIYLVKQMITRGMSDETAKGVFGSNYSKNPNFAKKSGSSSYEGKHEAKK